MAAAAALFLIGLFPSYVSILLVEKYYTAYWTGFWNLYGIFVTSVGLALDNYNSLDIWVLFFFAIIFVIFVYNIIYSKRETEFQKMQSRWVRGFGASWIATSLNWGLYVGFTEGAGWGILVAIIHALVMLGLAVWLG